MDNFSLSDIKAVMDNNETGGGFLWILLLFIIWFGAGGFGGGFGNGAAMQLATQADVQRGFDQQTTTSKLDQLAYGLSNTGYENAQLIATINNNLMQGFSNLAQQQASCCCETKQEILTNRYDAQGNTCAIEKAIHAEGEATRALIRSNRERDLENENSSLRLQQALCGVVRYPNSTTYSAGSWPFATNCCNGTVF